MQNEELPSDVEHGLDIALEAALELPSYAAFFYLPEKEVLQVIRRSEFSI